jgi:hypothetical protein
MFHYKKSRKNYLFQIERKEDKRQEEEHKSWDRWMKENPLSVCEIFKHNLFQLALIIKRGVGEVTHIRVCMCEYMRKSVSVCQCLSL